MRLLRFFFALVMLLCSSVVWAAGELLANDTTGKTVYAVIVNANSQVWTGSNTFATTTNSNYVTNAVTLTEVTGTGFYSGTFPAGITSAGRYRVLVYERLGGSAAVGDTLVDRYSVDWNGTGLAGAGNTLLATGTQTFNMTGNVTGIVSGSVGSVTGAVGSVTAAVTVTGTPSVNVTQIAGQTASASGAVTFPSSIGTSTYAGGNVTVGGYATNQDPAYLVLNAVQSSYNTAGSIGANIHGSWYSAPSLTATDPFTMTPPTSYSTGTYGALLLNGGKTAFNATVNGYASGQDPPALFYAARPVSGGLTQKQLEIVHLAYDTGKVSNSYDGTTRTQTTIYYAQDDTTAVVTLVNVYDTSGRTVSRTKTYNMTYLGALP